MTVTLVIAETSSPKSVLAAREVNYPVGMSSFLSTSFDENNLSNSNVPSAFASPKASEKDFSLVIPSGLDSTIGLSSPVNYQHPGDQNVSVIDLCSEGDDPNTSTATGEAVVAPGTTEETPEERMAREERESEELAWQLMQQENMEMYNLQLQYMQQSADHIDDDDLQLMRALMNEAGQQVVMTGPAPEGEGTGEDEEEEEESDVSNWDYDRLLQLGQQIGGKYGQYQRLFSSSASLLNILSWYRRQDGALAYEVEVCDCFSPSSDVQRHRCCEELLLQCCASHSV